MITSAAVKIYRQGFYQIIPVHRHKDASIIVERLNISDVEFYKEGFLTDKNIFLDREEAADHAYECGQLIEDAETNRIGCLISEDLW